MGKVVGKNLPTHTLNQMKQILADYEPIRLLPGQVVYNHPDGQAEKEERRKRLATPHTWQRVDSLFDLPGFKAVKR